MATAHRARALIAAVAALALLAVVTGCSRRSTAATPAADEGPAAELRLGYYPNVTHAAALIGVDQGFFARELGSTRLTTQTFNAGPDEVSALLGGSLDAAFIGSGPAINAFAKSGGEAVRLIAGATSGGAQLVVTPDVGSPADLVGKTVVTPQLANTQDVSLKKWLAEARLSGSVKVTNLDNPQTLNAFQRGDVQGAWLPEPWSSRLVIEAGAKVLVDESSLWPNGTFPSTVLIVRTRFLQQHPQTVRALLRGELAATDWANANRAPAEAAVNGQLRQLTGKPLAQAVLDRAMSTSRLTLDPLAAEFPRLAADQVTAGVARTAPSVAGLADLGPLNAVLQAAGRQPVDAAGLDHR